MYEVYYLLARECAVGWKGCISAAWHDAAGFCEAVSPQPGGDGYTVKLSVEEQGVWAVKHHMLAQRNGLVRPAQAWRAGARSACVPRRGARWAQSRGHDSCQALRPFDLSGLCEARW